MHFYVGAGGGDVEDFGEGGPTEGGVEGDGGGAGVAPEGVDVGLADEGFGGVEELAADALALEVGGDGHSAELVGGLVVEGACVEGEAADDGAGVVACGEMEGGGEFVAGEEGGVAREAGAEDLVAEGEDVIDGSEADVEVHGGDCSGRGREGVEFPGYCDVRVMHAGADLQGDAGGWDGVAV